MSTVVLLLGAQSRFWTAVVVATHDRTRWPQARTKAATTLRCFNHHHPVWEAAATCYHANHYVPLLTQPDYEHQRGVFLAAALAEGATIRDGITGNTLNITDQLVEVGATTDTPEHRSLTDASAMALELLRTDPRRWNARQHGRHTARFFVILARAGKGKTWFVRQMEHAMLHEAQAGRAAYLPLVMPVQRFAFLERASADTTGSLSAFDGM